MSETERLSSLPHGIKGFAHQESYLLDFQVLSFLVLFVVLFIFYIIFRKVSPVEPLLIERIESVYQKMESIKIEASKSFVGILNAEFRKIIVLRTKVPAFELTSEQLHLELESFFSDKSFKMKEFFIWSDQILFSEKEVQILDAKMWRDEVLKWMKELVEFSSDEVSN